MEAANEPLVSVGIPTYNRPEGLDRTLRNIRGQTYRNLEILISDNCSTNPETRAVATAHAQADSRVRYHRQETNIGLEANFKYVLARAAGEFFFWAADDDEWTPDFVDVCLSRVGPTGSAMTGMRNAVRPRGLLRWKPPIDLDPARGAFANALAFLSNPQPSLFYGLHRTAEVRRFLDERMYDFYDYFFILRQILTNGFGTAPQVCFHVGIESEAPVFKPSRPNARRVYEHWPFFRDALRAALGARSLGFLQKLRLAYLIAYTSANEFAHFERGPRPIRARLAAGARMALRALSPLFRVPLPPPPPTMRLPDDPADLCTMFVPHAVLEDPAALAAELASQQGHLKAKVEVIAGLETALGTRRTAEDGCASALDPLPADAPSRDLRARLGAVLRLMEEKEARIQELVRARARRAA